MINKFTPHFSLKEFTHSSIGNCHCIDNSLPDVYLPRAFALLVILEGLRTHIGSPVFINSGYRCFELNKLVGGVPNSRHTLACAVDISFTDFDTYVAPAFQFLQDLSPRFLKVYPDRNFIHVDFDPLYLETASSPSSSEKSRTVPAGTL